MSDCSRTSPRTHRLRSMALPQLSFISVAGDPVDYAEVLHSSSGTVIPTKVSVCLSTCFSPSIYTPGTISAKPPSGVSASTTSTKTDKPPPLVNGEGLVSHCARYRYHPGAVWRCALCTWARSHLSESQGFHSLSSHYFKSHHVDVNSM